MKKFKVHLISFNIYPFKNNALYIIADSINKTESLECLIKEFDFYENYQKDFSMDSLLEVYRYIKKNKPPIVGLSEYLWTQGLVDKTINLIKNEVSNSIIFLGGSSFRSKKYALKRMEQNPNIDYIIRSDGEFIAPIFLNALLDKTSMDSVPDIIFRKSDNVYFSRNSSLEKNLNPLINEDLIKNKIYLMETYRGCYQRCKFCIWSATSKKIKNINSIKAELNVIIKSKVPLCFFTDPHFGYSKKIGLEILEYISKNNIETKFGGFINLNYLDDEYCRHLKDANFDVANIGIQTLSKNSKIKSGRETSLNMIKNKIKKLEKYNIDYRSLDVIYGLPEDNFESFKETIDITYRIGKQRLFIHPLLVLPGSEFYENSEDYGLKFVEEPPWNILENNTYSFEDIIKSKILHIGQEIVARMFPVSFDFILGILNKNPADYMYELGMGLINNDVVSLDIDLFDGIRKIKGYDDGFRKKLLIFLFGGIAEYQNEEWYERLKETLIYESFNYPLYYFNIRYNKNNYSFINERITLSAQNFSEEMLDFVRDYNFDYPIHTVKDYNELLHLKKGILPIDIRKIILKRNFEIPIKT